AFLDGDYSDYPGEMKTLISPITEGGYDLVIGSRTIGERQRGALLPQALVGNSVATWLIKLFYGVIFADLGPFRAI
ncbi:MAG: glycosyltransferase family 2 protein, partial [Candidatus Dadabacteria bacterium]|nr:glycosyltransferase family 2 protein [Candidatus Dadabacteria bacterium]